MVELVIERSGLKSHYQVERDGKDRIENLEELVNAIDETKTRVDGKILVKSEP